MSNEVRFGFGKNWNAFLNLFSERRLQEATDSLKNTLEISDFKGLSFCDAGSGSGLFSLAAAKKLGAKKIHSFDYDLDSVHSTQSLKDNFLPKAKYWSIEQGSILDDSYVQGLGLFDIVYSWGVLHHTGDMYKGFENVIKLVKPGGLLFISIYNDQGFESKLWHKIKKTYNTSGFVGKKLMIGITFLRCWSKTILMDTFRYGKPLKTWKDYPNNNTRGMSAYHDLIDWVGGYPFEVASVQQVCDYFEPKGFNLKFLKDCGGGLGCNEFVFKKVD